MDEPDTWGTPRYITLLMVLIAHFVVVAMLILASRSLASRAPAAASLPLEVIVFPTSPQPKQRFAQIRPHRLSGELKEWTAPLTLQSPSLPPATAEREGGAGGTGSGPDWAAEARRAVNAFEIRTRQPPPDNLISGSPFDDHLWWRKGPHKPGDRFKTANGDWVVWIDAHCYQIATAGGRSTANTDMARTVCPKDAKDLQH
jgi:hypothetical protein